MVTPRVGAQIETWRATRVLRGAGSRPARVRPYMTNAQSGRNTQDEQSVGIGNVGYEINFNREFFQCLTSRTLRRSGEEQGRRVALHSRGRGGRHDSTGQYEEAARNMMKYKPFWA